MSFLDLLKIEFMKVKRSKIVPLIFIAPLLVVVSGAAGQPLRIIHCQILCAYLLFVYGDGGVFCRICNRWVDCDTDNGRNRNPADPISSEMVLGAVSDYAAVHCGYVGHHCAV